MKLSIVSTLYNTAGRLDELYDRLRAAAEKITPDFELIFINDGSPDDALARALALQERDARIVVVDLSRNFGHHKAIMAGLTAAQGEFVFLLDSDLEEPPEVLVPFYEKLNESDADVVYGFQSRRRRGIMDTMSGQSFYRLFNRISDVKIPPNLMTIRLMTRRYLDSFLLHSEREISLAGLWASTGYRQIGLPVDKMNNRASSYNFWRRATMGIDTLVAFSDKPLVFTAAIGGVISLLSFFVIVYLVIKWLTSNIVSGWTSVIASIWLVGGLTIFFMGVVGLYVSKIFVEVKQRPYPIVRKTYRAAEKVQRQP